MAKGLLESLKERRSYYSIGKESSISDEQMKRIIEDAVKYTPSAFNSQSARVVVLFREHHDMLWHIVLETLRKIVPAEKFAATDEKIATFANGYATVLYFEDTDVITNLQEQFAAYKDNFPIWSMQSNGMLQLVIWLALEGEGLGASLQHYNPLIDDEVKKAWGLPDSWNLLAQMPLGIPTAQPGAKTFEPIEKRLKIFE